MNEFRSGAFQRDAMGGLLRRLSPMSSSLSLYEINPVELVAMGKKLVLIDVDNTLVGWRDEQIADASLEWVAAAKAAGLQLCILSNTRNPQRLARLAGQFDVQFLTGRFKPSRSMYLQALESFGVAAGAAIMIGDQLFTDVLGANRSGIDAIWVRPMTDRDFIGTKVSRLGEKLARRALYRHLHEPAKPIDEELAKELPPTSFGLVELARHPVVKQFMRFAVVGLSSTFIDLGLHAYLMFYFKVDGQPLSAVLGQSLIDRFPAVFSFAKDAPAAAFPVLKLPSASIALLNGFYWNRRWTFSIRERAHRFRQLQKFVLVSLTGVALSALISSGLNNIIRGHARQSWAVASIVAVIIVAFWNFLGQKFFAFREREAAPDDV